MESGTQFDGSFLAPSQAKPTNQVARLIKKLQNN
jgi:hypothetical protein